MPAFARYKRNIFRLLLLGLLLLGVIVVALLGLANPSSKVSKSAGSSCADNAGVLKLTEDQRAKIAQSLIDQLRNQNDLMLKLSIAIFGGTVAFMKWLHSEKQPVRWKNMLLVTLASEGISVLMGYLAFGGMIGATPDLFLAIDYSKPFRRGDTTLNPRDICSLKTTANLDLTQFIFLIFGLVSIFVVLFVNRGMPQKEEPNGK